MPRGLENPGISHKHWSRIRVTATNRHPLIPNGPAFREETNFEQALANYAGDPAIRAGAERSALAFRHFASSQIESWQRDVRPGLLGDLLSAPATKRLDDDEICRNMLIVLFGGISTVEALILNSLWSLAHNPDVFDRVRADLTLLRRVLDETMRWLSPVQSATRHVVRHTAYAGITLAEGNVVNCMLGAAIHDPQHFPNPTQFDIDRPNHSQHLGFATRPHICLGFRFAPVEAEVALRTLLTRLPNLWIDLGESTPPEGNEFRQPRKLTIRWHS